MSDAPSLRTACCIAGGGPAGIMAGFLLARAGVDVVVLEKHADFFRDFRGDTIHPSTLALMDELGLLQAFLQRPHSEARELSVRFKDVSIPIADFRHLPGRCKFIAFMPQSDFLDFIVAQAHAYPTFELKMQTEAVDVVREGKRVAGVIARTPQGSLTIRADLVIAADGRHSVLRERAALAVNELGVPIDVLWMRLSRRPGDPGQAFGNVGAGGLLVSIDRGDYYQCGLVIAKGGFEGLRARGLTALQDQIATLAPFLGDRVNELHTWDDVRLLTVKVDRLERWFMDGLVCIGDAAHAMSPVGGVGINLAIQDAVAAANILARPLLRGAVAERHLRALQRRRALPTRVTQALQVFAQARILRPLLAARRDVAPPVFVRVLGAVAPLRGIVARAVGIGLRPESPRACIRRARDVSRPDATRRAR